MNVTVTPQKHNQDSVEEKITECISPIAGPLGFSMSPRHSTRKLMFMVMHFLHEYRYSFKIQTFMQIYMLHVCM